MKHLIKIALFLLAAVAAFFVYSFTEKVSGENKIVPYLAAGSLVGAYVGLAFANIESPKQRQRAIAIAWSAMFIEAAYGLLYVLSIQSPELFVRPLDIWFSVVLAALHGSAFSVLCFAVSMFVLSEQLNTESEQVSTVSEERDLAIIDAISILVDSVQSSKVQVSTPTAQKSLPLNSGEQALDTLAASVQSSVSITEQTVDNEPTDENIVYWHDVDKLSFDALSKRLNLTRSGAYAKYISAKNRLLKK